MSAIVSLVRLLQLASPALPVGAYSYSQGLEAAIESGEVHDASGARRWIGDALALSIAGMEAPIFLRLMAAWTAKDAQAAGRWNAEFVASREAAELRAETLQMGYSLGRLLAEMDPDGASDLAAIDELSFPAAFAFAAARQGIEPREALAAYLFAWVENQALAALKAIPLGQTDGQRLIAGVAAAIPAIVDRAAAMADEDLCNFAPGLAILSARHETQYTRIFRS